MDRESLSEWAKDKPLSILQLDPADRAVLRIADERDAIQKKTFTKWVNKHLKKANRRVDDLFDDLRDGHNLLSLLEVLSGEHLPREKGKMRFHMLQNAQMALDFLRYKKIKLVNIRAEDIVDGNPKLTLGLIWTIILHFQISDIVVGKEDNVSAREALLRWARRSTSRYPGVRVNDFTTSWRDGLAFSALVHRNRPDLLDWRKIRNDLPRERLEHTFTVVEREYGVTRLLDPEDVDTNEPDEKSLITYISSLYDVFPEPPTIHPLFDMESQRRVHEYRDLAQQYIYWCREKTAYFEERTFPSTVIEMKRLFSDLQHIRKEEISARQREKSKLIEIYKELERYFESVGEIDVEMELRPDAIDKAWYRMQTALKDRELILQQEIERMEQLQRLADKVQREIKHVDKKLNDLESRINEESRRIERLHPVDAKNIVESLEMEIRRLEEPIQDMNHDCRVLSEGRYVQVEELHKKVNNLHQRWAHLRAVFHTNLIQKLTSLKYPVHETTMTRQTRLVVESRQIETNSYFKDLQEHIEWCQSKLKDLLTADYGSDLPSVKDELDRQQQEHKIIDQFHSKVLNDERHQTMFSGDDLNLYQQRLNQLQKVYAELLSISTKRFSDLDSLQHFLVEASTELQWLSEKEQIEITRDWADKDLDLSSVHRYYENLMSELEKRELHFGTILDRGENLLSQQHPASKCIESHLTVLQQQWAWLLQLTLCLEVHLKHATEHHQFFTEISDAEQWLSKRDEILNSKYSQSDFSLDQGETLLRGMQDLREEFNIFGETIANLQTRAQIIVPLKKRRQQLTDQVPIQAICAYQQQHVRLDKGEMCTLLDNSSRVKWRVRTTKGHDGLVPSACLLMPPPNKEAVDAAERLKRLFDRSVSLWQKKHLRLRQNMIFATIRVVKGWDFDQFLAMGSEQRTAIRRALNDDANKLLSEGDPNDPQLRRLRREMDEVNRLFEEFEKRAKAEEESKQASRLFTEECISIKGKLENMARELEQIISAPLPRDLYSLDHVVEIHADFERRLQQLDPELQHMQGTFRTIALKTPALKKSLDNLLILWKELNTLSNLHKDRLKLLEMSLAGLEDNEHFISEMENEFAKHHDLPSSPEALQTLFKQLTHMQDLITQQQPQMEKMTDSAEQLGRMGVPTKVLNDLKRLHSNVERLNTRWSALCNQLADRMHSCENAIALMKNLQSSVQVEESWVDGTTEKLSAAMPNATSAYELDKLLKDALERKQQIVQVNITGDKLLREMKIYSGKSMAFIDWLVEIRPSFSTAHANIYPVDNDSKATHYFNQRLDNLNTKYDNLLQQLSKHLQIADGVKDNDMMQFAESLRTPLQSYNKLNIPEDRNVKSDSFFTTKYISTEYTTAGKRAKNSADNNNDVNVIIKSQQLDESDSLKRDIQGSHEIPLKKHKLVTNITVVQDPKTGCTLTIDEGNIKKSVTDVRNEKVLIDYNEDAKREIVNTTVHKDLPQTPNYSEFPLLQNTITPSTEKGTKIPDIINTPDKDNDINDRIDIDAGLYHLDSGITITLAEAYEQGLLARHESVSIKSNSLCLSDAIAHGLVDISGYITDRNTGDKLLLAAAINNQLINPDMREIVNAKNDTKVTLNEALKSGILNSKTGRYFNELTKEKLTYTEAKNRQLIVKPYTLKDICDLNLIDKHSKITSAMRREKLTISQAIEAGVLDYDLLKCITKRKGELVTLKEALNEDIVLPTEGKYKDYTTGDILSIPEAVNRGLISSVSQKTIFEIDGFKGTHNNDFVSFNVALARGILRKKGSEYMLETNRDSYVPLNTAVTDGFIRPEVYEMFTRDIGVQKADGKQLNLFDLCFHNMIDSKSGFLVDPSTGKTLPLNLAIENKFITPQGALLLSSLLNITLTTETVTRTINRYVTVNVDNSHDPNCDNTRLSFSEAIQKGLIDEETQLFREPQSGKIYSIQQALTYGLLEADSDNILPESIDTNKPKSTIINLNEAKKLSETTIINKEKSKYIEIYRDNRAEESDELKLGINSQIKEIYNSPHRAQSEIEGYSVVQREDFATPEPVLIEPGVIFDPSTALVICTQSDQTLDIFEATRQGLIQGTAIKFIDPQTKESLSITEAVNRKIYNPEHGTIQLGVGTNNTLSIIDAIKQGALVIAGAPLVAVKEALCGMRFVIDPQTGSQIPIEIAYERGIVTKDELSNSQMKLQKMRKIILKPGEALEKGILDKDAYDILMNEQNFIKDDSKVASISQALTHKLFDGTKGKISDLQSGRIFNIKEAVEQQIIDPYEINNILVPIAKRLSIPKLMEQGLIDVNANRIVHPEGGYLLNILEAIICEILDPFSMIHRPVNCSIEEAIKKEIIDVKQCTFTIDGKVLNIAETIKEEIYDKNYNKVTALSPVGMTLPVIVERNLLNVKQGTIIHPATEKSISLREALENDFILSIPYSPKPDSIELLQAVEQRLLDTKNKTFTHPNKSIPISIKQALETGILAVKPLSDFVFNQKPVGHTKLMTTDNVLHSITTKTIEFCQGYDLISNNEVQNVQTGEICSIQEAKAKGILCEKNTINESNNKDEDEQCNETTVTCQDDKSYVIKRSDDENTQIDKDISETNRVTPTMTIFTHPTSVTHKDTIDSKDTDKHINIFQSENIKNDKQSSSPAKSTAQTLKETAQLGAAVIVGGPILAGKAIFDALKGAKKDREPEITSYKPQATAEQSTLSYSEIIPVENKDLDNSEDKPKDTSNDLTIDNFCELQIYDKNNLCFTNPITGNKISFQTLIAETDIFNFDTILVKDLSSGKYEDLTTALERPLLDKHNGNMVDPKTGKKIPFFECVTRKWIIRDDTTQEIKAPMPITNMIDPKSGKVMMGDGQLCTIADAINNGILDMHSISVRDPVSGEVIPLRMAIELGVVNMQVGTVIDIQTLKEIPLEDAFKLGFLVPGTRKPISLEAAVRKGLYDPITGKLFDSNSNNQVDIQKSIDIGLIDPKISLILDTKNEKEVKLDCAIEDELVISESGKLRDTKVDQLLPLDVGLERKLLKTANVTWSLPEVLQKEYYMPNIGKVFNPSTGEAILLQQAINLGFIELDTCLIKDDENHVIVSGKQAADNGILDTIRGSLSCPNLTLDEAFVKGYIISTKKPLSLVNCLMRGLYDPKTSKFLIDDKYFDLASAINLKLINAEELIILDPKTNTVISLSEAISKGYIEPVNGLVVNPFTGTKMTLDQALENNLLIPPKRKRSLPEAVHQGLYDCKTGEFSSTTTREKLSTEHAIRRGILDPHSTLVNLAGKVVSFDQATKTGIVDSCRGTVKDKNQKSIDFREAFDNGVFIEAKKPLRLSEALMKNLYNEADDKFMDPKTGQKLSFIEAFTNNLLSIENVQIKDLKTGQFVPLELSSIKDSADATLYYDNKKFTVKEALDSGIIIDTQAPISLQKALRQGYFDENSGKLIDMYSGRKISLFEGIRSLIINPALPCYFNEVQEEMYSLSETCRVGIINREEAVFREPGSKTFLSLPKALTLGLIIDIENGNFGLYELLAMQLYDIPTRTIINPITLRKISLKEACTQGVISLTASLINNEKTSKYIPLANAINEQIIDDKNNTYKTLLSEEIDLQEARHRGLIVSSKRPLSLQSVIKMKLFHSDTNTFYDPISQDSLNLLEAIQKDFIDPSTTLYKNYCNNTEMSLDKAIANGDIDYGQGIVFDPETKKPYTYEVALGRGILTTITKTLANENFLLRQQNSSELLEKKRLESNQVIAKADVSKTFEKARDMSLEEAIKSQIIDPKSAVIRDYEKFTFVRLEDALKENKIDLSKRTLVDPKMLFFAFDPTLTVYLRQPITFDYAVDNKILDLETGLIMKSATKLNEQTNDAVETPECVHSLKDAITMGIMDPDSAVIKDFAKSSLVRLPEAFRKGLIDANRANVLNTQTSKLYPLKDAYNEGLLMTPKHSLSLLEAITFNLYNPLDGTFIDPFQIHPNNAKVKKFTLAETITNRLIDPSLTMTRNTATGDIIPLTNAITNGLVNAQEGYVIDHTHMKNNKIDLKSAVKKGLLLPAEQRQAVFEKFNTSEENVNELLKWINMIEHKIATIGGPQESIHELHNQISAIKQIREEIENQQRPVATCLEQIRQIVLTGSDVLSAPEVNTLENSGRELRLRIDRANDRTLRLLRRLDAGRDELTKVRSELDTFSTWLQSARRTLEDKERALTDLYHFSSHIETVREFFGDVIRHQADLRFITMAAQKFVDESKEFLKILNEFRTSLPQRLPHIEPAPIIESSIRQEVNLVSAQYKDLMNRVSALQERFSKLGIRQREYQENLDKAYTWVRSIQPQISRILSEPIGGDPKSVQVQLNETKTLYNEINSNGRLVDNAQQALNSLMCTLDNQLSPSEMKQLEMPITELKEMHQKMLDSLIEHCKMLDKTLMQTQDVQDALDNLNNWVNQIEDKFKLQLRPASLIKDRLEDQIREHKALTNDMQSHQASLDSIQSSTLNLKNTTSNVRITKKVETNLQDVLNKFNKLNDKMIKRGELFGNVYAQLCRNLDEFAHIEREIANLQDSLDSRDISSLPANEFCDRINEISKHIHRLTPLYENCIQNGKDLLNHRDVADTNVLRDRIKSLEKQWRNINISLEERIALSKQKAEHQTSYETLKDQILSWLASMEAQISSLAPVAIDMERIRQQNEELKPIYKNYRDQAQKIDKINDLGAHYDALIRPDSPMRKRSTLSPNKRTSPLSRMSGEARSPSPNKGGILSPLSTGSSGFGSRRSSQDGFQLSELSIVQQQLNEINNRYGLIGVRLNDRQNELDNMTEEVRKHYENLKNLVMFLERIQRQLSKETISNKDEADHCNKQARKILEDMYEKQTLLDTTKTQIKDILRRKSDVPGAEQLRIENENVIEKWKQLSDICKNRIEFTEKLRDFLDTYNILKNWLDSKERMLTVLGPISSDPRMVQSQVQQVQVLREEFRAQHPQLKHFQDIAQYILSHAESDAIGIDKKLKDIKSKWEELIKRLEDRAKSLGGAADSSKEFDAALSRLKEALQQISDQLDALPTNNDLQENLRKIENIERQLEGQRPLLADAEQSAAALCHIISDAASRADINSRVVALEKQYQALQKKLDTKKAETEATLRDGRHFAENCSKTLGWLSTELANLSELFLISAHKPTLQHQIDTYEPVYRDVIAREHEIVMLINKGKTFTDRQQDRTTRRDLDRIQQLWEKLRREVHERHTRLQTSMEYCKKYSKISESFLAWLRSAEDKLADLIPGILSKPKLDNQLRDLQTFRNEVWKHSGEYENTKGLGETFLGSCDIDKETILVELENMRERWERLSNDLTARALEIENYSRSLIEFNEELRKLDHALGRCEDRLSAHDALGVAAKDPKLLDRVKAIRDELANLKKPLQSLKNTAEDICAAARSSGGDAEYLLVEINCIVDRMKNLQGRLDDRLGDLQSAATAVYQYNEQIKILVSNLNALEYDVEKLSQPAREIKRVQAQIDEALRLQNRLDATSSSIHECECTAEALVDAGFSTDSVKTREQISVLRKTLTRLDSRVRDYIKRLEETLDTLTSFYDMHTNALHEIDNITDEYRHLKPVGSELDQIRRQQDDFLNFRAKKVDPLSEKIQKVNYVGCDLVRSAATGVSTNQIEKDLEKLNDHWNAVKELLNERSRRLDAALLQSGKFQEALAGLSKWLIDTEDMVKNQKLPSSDYKVVKAQLQEQKFLKKMLADRQHSMTSLCTLSKEVLNHCDVSERNAIEKQLQDLVRRFDSLTNGAEQRQRDLEEAMEIAKQFHDKIIPLETWLEVTERSVKSMELVPTDEEKIQERIVEHENLHDEILGKKTDFTDTADIAGQLMHLISDDEAGALSEKVRKITDRYTGLVESSENIGSLLNESRKGLRHLVLTYQELVIWMEYMENELKRFHTIPVYIEKLMEQMDNLLEVNENIANHATNVEATVESGAELMKHISNDEAIQLKDKLDSLQRRYGELATRGGDLLKGCQNALPLVQQFHDAHNRLLEWMQVAEGALSVSEPRQFDILRLEGEVIEMRPILDTINLVGPQLCQLSPGEGASVIENIIARVNRRFDAIVEQIQRKAERLNLSNQRAKEVTNDVDELLEWFREMDSTLRESDLPAIEPKVVRGQLQEHRSINDDISSQKGRVRDVTTAAKKVLRESAQNENIATLREKLDDLKDVVETVVGLCSERLGILEQALALSEHFADSHSGLSTWLDDMEQQVARLSMPALRPDLISQQQDKNERLLQSINEHKPLLDKLNKTGETLGLLVTEEDNIKINEILDTDNSRYMALRHELRDRQQALENALQESSQFADKIDGMLRALVNTVDQVNQLDPLSAVPQKIREQMEDNAAIMQDLDKRSDAFTAVQRAANDVIAKASNKSDPAVRDIKSKLEKLNNLWNNVQKATKKRGSSLDEILKVAKPFWSQLQSVMKTLKDLEETLSSQEPPATQPKEIEKQQVALQEIRQEIDQTKPEVEQVRRNGNDLIKMCGESDKPEVKKHIEDLDNAWDNITVLYAKREENLIDAMEKAMEFHEVLQSLLKFLTYAEEKLSRLDSIGTDIDGVKKQIEQLKSFKEEVDPHMVEVEALNRQAIDLTERTSTEQAASIREPLSIVNRRWEGLLRGMVERQKQLEHALLHLGQFQHALNELLVWINKTDNTLDQLRPIPGDPQLLEVELAKLKVLANDVQAHQNSVDTLNDAGRQLIESEKGSVEASTTQDKLRKLNQEWKLLLQKASDRQHELEEYLREAHEYIAEVQDILGWLGDVDAVIGASKPVGGLPETATEQLERFMEVYNELEENRPKVETIQAQGHEYIKRQNQIKVSSSNLQHTMRTLKQRWDAVVSRASDKKIKLEIALKEATEFHETLQAFVEWLTQAEKQLTNAQPVSRVLETIQTQIEGHKILQKDVSTHREAMLLLDKKGTHLKYFSQKQDVILIKNVLVSVQHRWERIVSKAAERTRALDHGYKEAREFNDTWNNLMQYLQETECVLDKIIEEATASKEPQKLKKCIAKLKDTHRQLMGKQTLYDTSMRSGKSLIERAPKSDEVFLGKMLGELKDTWSRVLSKSIEHQRKLEEALLLSGQFSDALGELLDWLRKSKGRLNENGLVHGDLETVQGLCEHHRHIEQDLYKRSAQMQGVLKTGRELERSGNSPDVGHQLDELQSIWDEVQKAIVKRGERLQLALKDAEKLNSNIQSLFDWLDHAEHKLRYAKNAPDDEKISREMKDAHTEFLKELHTRERQKIDIFKFAEEIIAKAYPDAIPIIRNWLTIIDERWEEVKQWAINRELKLEQHLQSLKDLDKTIEDLLTWLNGLEATLLNLERESLPEEIPLLEKLIQDHKEFMENTARRQNEVDRACKPKQLPPSTRRISRSGKTPVRSSSQDIREQSPEGTLRRQSFKGSREHGLNARKSSSRLTPNRDTPDRDRLPHYGPRFSPTSLGPEVEFRSSRAKLLWDKWRHVWMLSWERQRRLNDHLIYLKDLERVRNFSWDDWRKRFLKYMNHKKSRLTDLFRKMDKDNNGLIPRTEFIDGILNTKFDTSRMEMGAVADLFDRNGEGLIDWQEFIAALRPDWQERKPVTDSDKIHDEVKRLVMLCTCRQKFRVFQVGEGKYRFGDSQKLRLVRILRSTVMVRVGGGWVALDEFLQKNDPCRAKGRTNVELREQFILADGVSQSMAAFTPRRSVPNTAQSGNSSTNNNLPSYMSGQGPIIKVRERSVRSVPMSKPTRSSLSASTPDSLSDNEAAQASGRYTPRKVTYTSTRTGLAAAGSRPTSKPNSRPLSRQGSKTPSRQGSTLSLDSTDEATPSRIPQRKLSSTPRPSRLSVPATTPRANGANTLNRKTASGSSSPAPVSNDGMCRSSSIPALTGFGFKSSLQTSRIPIKKSNLNANCSTTDSTINPNSLGKNISETSTPSGKHISGTSTPSGTQTSRKSSADSTLSSTMRRTSRGTTPVEKREPFRL